MLWDEIGREHWASAGARLEIIIHVVFPVLFSIFVLIIFYFSGMVIINSIQFYLQSRYYVSKFLLKKVIAK